MNQPISRIVRAAVCLIFIATDSLRGFSAIDADQPVSQDVPSFLQIEIPDEIAVVEEFYEAPAKIEPRLILHIQNAHGNYQAQTQIKKLLEYLHDNYGFSLLFVEGAAEELNPENLRLFADSEKNAALAEYMARKGQLTGPDLYLLEAPSEVKAVGIEDAGLYRSNYEAFTEVYAGESDVANFLRAFEAKMDLLSSRFFNADTRRMLDEWKKFQKGHRDFLPFMNNLSKDAKKILGLDLESLFSQVEWPQITRMIVMQSMEAELDREKATEEKRRLLVFLKGQGISDAVIRGIEKLEQKRIYMNEARTDKEGLEYAPRYLLERLVEEAGAKGFRFHDYPVFSLYAGYLILESELESRALFDEIERLFQKILDQLTVTEQEKDLLEIFRDEELLVKLLHLEITRKEWSRAYYRLDWIRPETMVKRLKTVSERLMDAETHQFVEGWDQEGASEKAIAPIFEAAFQFYEYARQRESAFHSTIKEEMGNRKKDKAVLITGGFHTDGLMELFREDEVSYGILTPVINVVEGHENYVATMMQDHPSMFDLAGLEVYNFLQSMKQLKALGVDDEDFLKQRVEAYFAVADFKDVKDAESQLNQFNRNPFNQNHIELQTVVEGDEIGIAIRLNGREFVTDEGMQIIIPLRRDDRTGYLKPSDHFEEGNKIFNAVQFNTPVVSPALTAAIEENGVIWEPVTTNVDGVDGGPDIKIMIGINRVALNVTPSAAPPNVEDETPVVADYSPLGVINREKFNLDDLDRIMKSLRDAGVEFRSTVVALLVNGVLGGKPRSVEDFEAIASIFKERHQPAKGEALVAHPVIDFDFRPGIATVVFDSDARLTVKQMEDRIVIVGKLLAVEANQLIYLSLIFPTEAQRRPELALQLAEAFVNAKSILKEDLKLNDEVLEELMGRIKVKANEDTDLNRVVVKNIETNGNQLHRKMRAAGLKAPTVSDLIENHSAVIYAENIGKFISVDTIRGQLAEAKTGIRLAVEEEFVAVAVIAALLAVHGGDADTIKQKTQAALALLEELGEGGFGREKRWGFTQNFPLFSKAVQTAIIALEAELRTAAAA